MLYLFSGIDLLPKEIIDTYSSFLPKWRLDKMQTYRFASDRKLCAIAYLMVVYALKKEGVFNTMPEFGYNVYGKPYLSNYADIYFNLSHCNEVVACILSDSEVGVDVEKVFKYDDDLARAICNGKEYQSIAGITDPDIKARKFTELWTMKESLVKWRGTGLDGDPREILPVGYPELPDESFQISSTYDEKGDFCISVCKTKICRII